MKNIKQTVKLFVFIDKILEKLTYYIDCNDIVKYK